MAKQQDNLSHHEQLRLDYLYKNFHYLNEREQEEYNYLMRKAQGEIFEPSYREEEKPVSDKLEESLPVYPNRTNRRKDRQQTEKAERPKKRRIEKPSQTDSGPEGEEKKPKKRKKKWIFGRVLKWVLTFIVLVLAGMLVMFIKGVWSVPAENKPTAEVFHGEDSPNGTNILILGTDGRVGQTSDETRTDTIMVLNVGGKDKKLKLVSFMRDTLVNIEGVSQPGEYDQKLNSAYTIGEQNNHQGAELVREMLKDNFDINIKYYALVDFSTFATAIDTLFPEGVAMNAQFSTIDGQPVTEVEIPDDLNMKDGVVPNQTIKVGPQRMDGRTLLNYARFRKDDEGDFGRTRRQQEVLTAVIQQSKNPMKLFSGSEALGKVYAMTSTNLPYTFPLTNSWSLLSGAAGGVERVTIPDLGDWQDAYDMYGGQGLLIDFEAYKAKLQQMGLR